MEPALAEKMDHAETGAQTLERFIAAVGASLHPPILYHSGKEHYGFRFGAPDERHFCLLKAVRALSAWRAAALLARQGYAQEVFVLLRTLDEFTTHIDFVLLAREGDGTPTKEAAAYLQAYFADFARNDSSDYGKVKLRQGDVHKVLGKKFDEERDTLLDTTERALSHVYLSLSNYVHGRYPEIMDMYGGDPARWHTNGMLGTPKEAETAEFVLTSLGTVSQSLRLMAAALNLKEVVRADPVLFACAEVNDQFRDQNTATFSCRLLRKSWVRRFYRGSDLPGDVNYGFEDLTVQIVI
jgi:hypothetical protein